MYIIDLAGLHLEYSPEECILSVRTAETEWKWSNKPYIQLADKTVVEFDSAKCESSEYKTGVGRGVRAVYRDFPGAENIVITALVWIKKETGELAFEVNASGDTHLQISRLAFPAAFEYGAKEGEGYTVLPRMQGTLVPAGSRIQIANGQIQERDGYMSFFGQVRGRQGYIGIFETPWEAYYAIPEDMVQPFFIESMGTIRYARKMLYAFLDGGCDYVRIAKYYRSYVINRDIFVSLREKIARNPNIAKLIGTPIIHTGIAIHICKQSVFYVEGDDRHNDNYTSFEQVGKYLTALHDNGLEKAYLHLDGWGNHGYDNLHPDIFPPHEAAGGAEGMKALSETTRKLGFLFGIHDQYRDYYYDAESFDINNAITCADGSHPFWSVWNGGPQTVLCQTLAPDYVQRNYNEFERLGIKLDGSYLDVYSIVGLDECVNPDHPMTREECARLRGRCFSILMERGIIPQSEEAMDTIIPYIAFCHHAPYYTTQWEGGDAVGIPVPLFSLVYHDALIVPWFGGIGARGGWGIPNNDNGYMHAILNGDTVYCNIGNTREDIDYMRPVLDLHSRVALQEMVNHEFIDGNIRHQRSVFADGTTVEVNFDTDEYRIY